MRALKHLVCLLSLLLLVPSCAHVQIPDTEVCAVNGIMAAGASCDKTLSNAPRTMKLDEFIDFLEPNVSQGRGAALCQSANDWNKIKTALEQACYLLRNRCSYEMQVAIENLGDKIKSLSYGVAK